MTNVVSIAPDDDRPDFVVSPSDMEDADIEAELDELGADAMDIQRQLEDDKEDGFPAGQVWRSRARSARRYKLARIDELRTELHRREKTRRQDAQLIEQRRRAAEGFGPIQMLEHNRKAQEAAFERKMKLEALKTERMKWDAERSRARGEMFVIAAAAVVDKATRERIWEKAREMFPDAPGWEEAPKVTLAEGGV